MQDVRTDREKYIGGSDIPAIMGISPFRTREELLKEKAYGEMGGFNGNEYTEYGNVLEPKIRDFINSMLYSDYAEDKVIVGIYRYHADGYDKNTNTVLEIKTTGEYTEARKKMYLAQLLWGMKMYGAQSGILAVYERPIDFDESFDPFRLTVEHIEMKNHIAYMSRIEDCVRQFVDDVKKLRENPNMSLTDLIPSQIQAIAYQMEDIEQKLKIYEEERKHYDDLKEELRLAMLKANIKSWETPSNTKITLVKDTPPKEVEKFDAKAFEEENPEMYAKYVKKTMQGGKKGYVKVTFHEG